ncbi:hypothetical protein ARSEF4850_007579 [Beauveria asiatica]
MSLRELLVRHAAQEGGHGARVHRGPSKTPTMDTATAVGDEPDEELKDERADEELVHTYLLSPMPW